MTSLFSHNNTPNSQPYSQPTIKMKAKLKIIKLCNGNSKWLHPITRKNAKTIYDLFIKLEKESTSKKKILLTKKQISDHTGLNTHSITTAIEAFSMQKDKNKNYFRFHARGFKPTKKGVSFKAAHKIELIKKIEKEK